MNSPFESNYFVSLLMDKVHRLGGEVGWTQCTGQSVICYMKMNENLLVKRLPSNIALSIVYQIKDNAINYEDDLKALPFFLSLIQNNASIVSPEIQPTIEGMLKDMDRFASKKTDPSFNKKLFLYSLIELCIPLNPKPGSVAALMTLVGSQLTNDILPYAVTNNVTLEAILKSMLPALRPNLTMNGLYSSLVLSSRNYGTLSAAELSDRMEPAYRYFLGEESLDALIKDISHYSVRSVANGYVKWGRVMEYAAISGHKGGSVKIPVHLLPYCSDDFSEYPITVAEAEDIATSNNVPLTEYLTRLRLSKKVSETI